MTGDDTCRSATDDSSQTIDPALSEQRIDSRAGHPPPVEERVGSDDPEAQARAVLAASEERMIERERRPHTSGERRTSDEATDPVDMAQTEPAESDISESEAGSVDTTAGRSSTYPKASRVDGA